MKKNKSFFLVLFLVIVIVVLCFELFPTGVAQNNSAQIESNEAKAELVSFENLELPAKLKNEQIIRHTGFTLSYNAEWLCPNWVAWELTSSETEGVEERAKHFKPDPNVYGTKVVTKDYSNSGYDRGHMAPAADMKWSEQAMRESFYMTNICPQIHNLNAGDWKELEELCRTWANHFGQIYICCGPIVSNNPKRIGENGVAVPDAFFKVILAFKNKQPQSIAFLMANKPGNKPLQTYAMSIEDMETVTGLDFFTQLPDSLEQITETDLTLKSWIWQ